jgi:hypothetical protein
VNKPELSKLTSEIEMFWNEHLSSPFPDSDSYDDTSGIDLRDLDTWVAGCVSTFVETGNLDVGRAAVLGLCYRDLLVAQSVLVGEERNYSSRLEKLAELVLRAVVLKNQF